MSIGGNGPAPQGPAVSAVNSLPEHWTVLTGNGVVVLAQSEQAYAVYDERTVYGRWPLTQEGYGYAVKTYEAHQQSLAHGLAYTATGYEDPARLGLPTEAKVKSQTYASPMSYVGSTRRIVAWANRASKRSPAATFLTWSAAVLALVFMWAFLLAWYSVVFVLFGIFMIPYRLVRRSQRKNLHVQQTALATQQAMLQQMAVQQQQMMRQQQPGAYMLPASGTPLPPPGSPAITPPPGS